MDACRPVRRQPALLGAGCADSIDPPVTHQREEALIFSCRIAQPMDGGGASVANDPDSADGWGVDVHS
jgi:hypothetical protein